MSLAKEPYALFHPGGRQRRYLPAIPNRLSLVPRFCEALSAYLLAVTVRVRSRFPPARRSPGAVAMGVEWVGGVGCRCRIC